MLSGPEMLQKFMPHSMPMVLIDRVLEYDMDSIVTETEVGPRLPCFMNNGVPAYLGIEIMAQSVAIWSGLNRAKQDQKPSIGYLLGSRRFECAVDVFSSGSTLRVGSRQVLENEGLAVFQCELSIKRNESKLTKVIDADISVYST